MTRLIDQVAETTKGRRDNYGRPLLNFTRIAIKWHNHLADKGKMAPGKLLDPEDVAWMMGEFKDARAEHSWQPDNVRDTMGYMDCLDDIHQNMIDLGYKEGVEAFYEMDIGQLCALRDRLVREVPTTSTTWREGDDLLIIDMSAEQMNHDTVNVFNIQEEYRKINEFEDQQRAIRFAQGKEARDESRSNGIRPSGRFA